MMQLMLTLTLIGGVASVQTVYAQCPMCKENVKASMKAGGTQKGKGWGLNDGILYLLAIPYILASAFIVGIVLYRRSKRRHPGFVQKI
jgi:hypothetical protein